MFVSELDLTQSTGIVTRPPVTEVAAKDAAVNYDALIQQWEENGELDDFSSAQFKALNTAMVENADGRLRKLQVGEKVEYFFVENNRRTSKYVVEVVAVATNDSIQIKGAPLTGIARFNATHGVSANGPSHGWINTIK